jgi:hypothetical protein
MSGQGRTGSRRLWGRLWRFSSGPRHEPLGDDRDARGITPLLGFTDVRFDSFHQLGRHFPNAMFFRMLSRLCENLLFRLASHNVLTPAGWIHLGAFQDLGHELASFLIGVEMVHDDTPAVRHTLCLVCIGGNTFFQVLPPRCCIRTDALGAEGFQLSWRSSYEPPGDVLRSAD